MTCPPVIGISVSHSLQAPTPTPPGLVWTSRNSTQNHWFAVTYGNGLFVAIAFTSNLYPDNENQVMTSPDGITWTSRTSAADNWWGVTYGNGLFVAVAGFSYPQVMTSPDGIRGPAA